MDIFEFIETYLDKKVDYDGYYGAQCVDLFRQYCSDVLKIPRTESVLGAKDIVEHYEELPITKEHFELLSAKEAKLGDIVIWGSTATNQYGHIAIVLANLGNRFIVLEQDGFKQDGTKLAYRSADNIIGILRKRSKQ